MEIPGPAPQNAGIRLTETRSFIRSSNGIPKDAVL